MENRIAIMYDFDHTLSTDDMQKFGFFSALGLSNDFFYDNDRCAKEEGSDKILRYLFEISEKMKELGLKREDMARFGKEIQFFPGVTTWFERINEFGKKHGIEVEHYILSSGQKEIIEGCEIAKHFKKIFACEYMYDENGEPVWPKAFVNYTNKTQFIFRISKGLLNISDDSINEVMDKSLRSVSYENMVYIGDGFTDVPCMKLIKQKNGISISVYTERNKILSEDLYKNDRISYYHPADYREGSPLEEEIKGIIVRLEQKLKNK